MPTYVNKAIRIGLAGGLIGVLITNTKSAVNKALERENADGWRFVEMQSLDGANLFMLLVRLLLLLVTLCLFTLGSNYLLIFERET